MTNRRDLLDEALLRPGRFEVQMEVRMAATLEPMRGLVSACGLGALFTWVCFTAHCAWARRWGCQMLRAGARSWRFTPKQ